MGRRNKARTNRVAPPATTAPRAPDPVPGDNGDALARIAAFFQATFSDEWERLRLCPLQHGLEDMARLMKVRS